MPWLYVIAAGVLEVPWVMGLKYANDIIGYSIVAVMITISFILVMKAYRYLPVGVTYAVFTGIGTLGIVIAEWVISGGEMSVARIFFILLIASGVVGLKFTTKDH